MELFIGLGLLVLIIIIGRVVISKNKPVNVDPTYPVQETPVPINKHRELTKKPVFNSETSDYDIYLNTAQSSMDKEDAMTHEFFLFGTNAAVVWGKSASIVSVVCIKAFSKEVPCSDKYDVFDYNWHKNYWAGDEPRGCKQIIRSVLEQLKVDHGIIFDTQDKDEQQSEQQSKLAHLCGIMRARYTNETNTTLFGTKAIFFHSADKSYLHIVCIEAFNKGKPTTESYGLFRYHLVDKRWLESPKGGARELGKLIESLTLP
jgi:hypothetical protein